MKRIIFTITLLTLLGVIPAMAQRDSADASQRYKVVGTYLYGIYDNETAELVIDTVYPHVEILDDGLFEVSYIHWSRGDQEGFLPAPMVEFYDAEGMLVSRDYDALLRDGSASYAEVNRYAQAFGLRDLEAAVAMRQGFDYEAAGKFREAYAKYKQAYRLYPQLTIAKEYADAIMTNMRMKQDSVRSVMRQEAYENAVRQAAAMDALASSLSALGSTISQMSTSNRQNTARTSGSTSTRKTTSTNTSQAQSSTNKKKVKTSSEALRDYYKAKRGRTEWRTVTCHMCKGSGRYGVCAGCGGKGYRKDNPASRAVTCGCGDGKSRCPTCYGKGTVKEKHTVYE